MKLSFSTNRWSGSALDEFIDIAKEYKFRGIEIHNINEVTTEQASEINHKLLENKVKISCIDMVSDVSDVSDIRDGACGADVTAVVNVADVLDVGSEASPEEGVVSGTGSVDSGSGTLALVFFLVDVRCLGWRERRRSRSVSMCAKRKTVRRRSSSSAGISPVCT